MKWINLFVFLGSVAIAQPAKTQLPKVEKGEVYLPQTNPPVLIYKYEKQVEQKGGQQITETRFFLPDGSLAVGETLLHQDGNLAQYTIERKKEGIKDSLTVQGKNATFASTEPSGKTKTESTSWDKSHLVLPELRAFALANWDALQNGKSVDFRLAIVEKRDTFGFSMEKDEERDENGRKIVVLEVAPTSFFVSMAISPIYLDVDAQTKQLRRMRGFKFPKPGTGPNETRDIEADLVYLTE